MTRCCTVSCDVYIFFPTPSSARTTSVAFEGQITEEAATNCLVRIPAVQDILVVATDDSNHVGIIELQRCIQAIVVALPEMLPRIETSDFTTYAFNYS